MKRKNLPKCFISYCHDDADFNSIDAFENEIEKISQKRFEIVRDKKSVSVGESISSHESQITNSNIIILLLTPKYREKVISRLGGVYREYSMVMERFHKYQDDLKSGKSVKTFSLIPILFSGTHLQSILPEIVDSMYLDFTSFRANPSLSSFTLSAHRDALQDIRAQFDNVHNGLDSSFPTEYDEWLKLLFIESRHEVLREKYRYNEIEDVLRELFVKTKAYQGVVRGENCILIGRKGSGKSTIVDHFHRGNSDTYKEPIRVIVDNFDLGYLYTYLYSGPNAKDIDDVVKLPNFFEAVWTIFILQQCAYTLLRELDTGRSKVNLTEFKDGLRSVISSDQNRKWPNFVRTCQQVKTLIDNVISTARVDSRFLGDIATKLGIEDIVNFVIGEIGLDALRGAIEICQRRFIFALDGFDQHFEDFRANSLDSSANEEERSRRISFEINWLRGLLRSVLEMRSAHGIVQDKCDFCITIPQDRFIEVRDKEREDYRFRSITTNIQWSGIELSILLRKRLEGLVRKYVTDKTLPPLDRLEEIMSCSEIGIPAKIQISQQGNVNSISTFKYLLRHTFWRPRDLMYYVAAILANQRTAMKRGNQIDEAVIKAIVSRTTYDVIETEFIKEFQNSILNIRDIMHRFANKKIVLSFDEINEAIRGLNLKVSGGTRLAQDVMEKLEYLFNIGFFGLVLQERQLKESVYCRDSFVFSDGERIFRSMSKENRQLTEFVIHPIFSEYLMLDTNIGRTVCYYSDDYLIKNDLL